MACIGQEASAQDNRMVPMSEVDKSLRCAPACLNLIQRLLRVDEEYRRTLEKFGTSDTEDSMLEVCQVARKSGLKAKAVKMGTDSLWRLEDLAVLHLTTYGGAPKDHYVVFAGADKEKQTVTIFDPPFACVTLDAAEFSEMWDGYAVIVSKSTWPTRRAILFGAGGVLLSIFLFLSVMHGKRSVII